MTSHTHTHTHSAVVLRFTVDHVILPSFASYFVGLSLCVCDLMTRLLVTDDIIVTYAAGRHDICPCLAVERMPLSSAVGDVVR